jgi:hypothetical protein
MASPQIALASRHLSPLIMKRFFPTSWALLLALLLTAGLAQAQISGTYKRLELGAGIGATQSSGDLNNYPALRNTRLGGEVMFRYNFTTYFAARAYADFGTLVGGAKRSNDPFIQKRGYSFKTSFVNLGGLLEYHFFNFRGTRETYRFSPYIFAGFGLSNTIANAGRPYQEVASGLVPMIPFGIGVKKELGYRLNLAFEIRTTKAFTDAIDGLVTGGANTNLSPGFNNKNDLMYYAGVSVCYRFISIRCPESTLDYTDR